MAVEAAVGRLGRSTVDRLPRAARPSLDGDVGAGIVHLGLGAFHRAHQAVYTEDAIVAAGGDWGIVGVAPRSVDVLSAMAAQDRLYSVLTVGPGSVVPRTVGALTRAALGVSDLVPVAAEPFSQWVIEDEFPAGRPAWERAGAVLTTDAEPWERLLGTILDRRAAGARPVWAVLVLAAWMRFVRGYAADGTALPLDDPLADRLRAAVSTVDDKPSDLADALFAVDAVFPAELASDDEVRGLVEHWLTVLARGGAPAALAEASS
jgi:mannitol-1-phosphate/altronate dehydrogenase